MSRRSRTPRSALALWSLGLGLAVVLPATIAGAGPVAANFAAPQKTDSSVRLSDIVEIPYKTVVIEDDQLPSDVEVQVQEGSPGVRYLYAPSGYSETNGPLVTSQVISPATDRVIHRGTAVVMPIAEPAPEPEPEPAPVPETASRSVETPTTSTLTTTGEYGLGDLQFMGVVHWGGYKFTYYSQSVLPGGGLAIPGRHVNASGFVSDGDGYIVLAGSAPKGTVYETPFGAPGKIYDRGTVGNHLDVYTQ